MTIKLTVAGVDTVLPDFLVWVDEYKYSPVAQSRTRSLGGALIVQSITSEAGRPITLQGTSDYGWIEKAAVEALFGMCAEDNQMVLTLHDARTFNVCFAQPDGSNPGAASSNPPVDASPVDPDGDPQDDTDYIITIRLFTV